MPDSTDDDLPKTRLRPVGLESVDESLPGAVFPLASVTDHQSDAPAAEDQENPTRPVTKLEVEMAGLPPTYPVLPEQGSGPTRYVTPSEIQMVKSSVVSPSTAAAGVPGYEIQKELGRGGMGVVYQAVQTALKRTVALKMVTGGQRPSKAALMRFLAEAEAVASISHPNVVRVYEYGEVDGHPFLALEYLPGGSLSDRVKAGERWAPEDAARVMSKVARGVAAAHAQGIVHRDLKPHNVMLDAAGEPKLTDFGLAKKEGEGTDLTRSGDVLGTPAYMAPEQAKGLTKFVGPEADVWALGVMLYELMTGRRPFTSTDTYDLLLQVTTGDPEHPRKVAPKVPKDLATICMHCLTRERSGRYPTAKEMADDLDRFLSGEQVSVRPPGLVERTARWAYRKPHVAAAWGLLILTVALAGFSGALFGMYRKADTAKDEALTAKAGADVARRQAESAEAKEAEARRAAEAAAVAEKTAKEAEAKEREKAELAAEREKMAKDQLQAIRYGNTIGLAFREYQANDVQRARALLAESRPGPGGVRGWEWSYLNRTCNGELLRIDPNAGRTYSVAVGGANGDRLATAHSDGTVRLWDMRTGKALHVLTPGPAGFKAKEALDVGITADGGRVVSGGADGIVRLWNADNAQEIAAIPNGEDKAPSPVLAVAVTADGKWIAAGGKDGTLRVWDAADKKLFMLQEAGDTAAGEINSVRFSPDGKLIAVGGSSGAVKVYDRETKKPAYVVQPLKSAVAAVAITDDGRLAVGDVSGAVRLWNLQSGKVVQAFQAHLGKVASVVFSRDGNLLASAGSDRAVRVWDGKTGDRQLTLKGHTAEAWGVAFAPNGKKLASAGLDGSALVWDLTRPPEGWLLRADAGPVNAVAATADGSRLVVAGREKRVRMFSVNDDGPKSADPPEAKARTLPVAAEPDAAQGELAVAFADDRGRAVLSVTNQGELIRWEGDERTGWRPAEGGTVPLSGGTPITAAAISPDRRWVAIAKESGEVAVWDVNKREAVAAWTAHNQRVGALAFGPNGRLVTGARDGAVVVWDVSAKKEVAVLRGHTTEVLAVAVSPDGAQVATASMDQTARLWDANTGTPVWVLQGHLNWVRAVGFSRDGKRLVTGGLDGMVKVWDATTGFELLSLLTQSNGIAGVAFSPDDKRVFAGGLDGVVRVYDATPIEMKQ